MIGEHIALQILKEKGLDVKPNTSFSSNDIYSRVPGDILLGEQKTIEVKTSTYGTTGYRFYSTDFLGADYIMLICLNRNLTLDKFYVIHKRNFKPFWEHKWTWKRKHSDGNSLYLKKGGINEDYFKEFKNNTDPLTR